MSAKKASTKRKIPWKQPSAAARRKELMLQTCPDCGYVQYPSQEVCRRCLGGTPTPQPHSGAGLLQAATTLHVSLDETIRSCLPVRIGSIKLDCGPVLIAYLAESCKVGTQRVRVVAGVDRRGQPVMIAFAEK